MPTRITKEPSLSPIEYAKAAFQWANSLLDPIRTIYVRLIGSKEDIQNLRSIEEISATVIDLDKKIDVLELQFAVAKMTQYSSDLSFFLPKLKMYYSSLQEQMNDLQTPIRNSYLERKRREEIKLISERISKLKSIQVELGYTQTEGRDLPTLLDNAKRFADKLAQVHLILTKRGWGPESIDRRTSNIVHDFALNLSTESSLSLSPEDMQDLTRTIQARLSENFTKKPGIQNPEELAAKTARSQTNQLAQELNQILWQSSH